MPRTNISLDAKVKDMLVKLVQDEYTTVDDWISKQVIKEYKRKFVKEVMKESESKHYADLAKSYAQGLRTGLAESEDNYVKNLKDEFEKL